ncbi:hypothetical protein [Streptomyces sp. NPDC001914]|uniref:hypothetical protein n=1 Tax=Streptomyces sp. NPDC001914 TaxID=3364623 RepID=UPI0036C91949
MDSAQDAWHQLTPDEQLALFNALRAPRVENLLGSGAFRANTVRFTVDTDTFTATARVMRIADRIPGREPRHSEPVPMVQDVRVERITRRRRWTPQAVAAAARTAGVLHIPRRRAAALGATALAARLAGPQRPHLGRDWTAVLAGSPEDGVTHSATRQLVLALEFVFAALRMRASDLARPAWRPVDWLLSVQSRTNSFITTVVGAQAVYIVDDGGLTALVTEVWEPCGGAAIALYALTRWLRRLRGIELADTRPESGDREL